MSTCKKCGKKTLMLNTLCEECKKDLKDLELQEKKKKEEVVLKLKEIENEKLRENVQALINTIVKSATEKEVLMYSFFQCDLVKNNENSNIGTYVGGVLGGITGAMIGSAFNSNSTNYSGGIGILIITEQDIIMKTFPTKIYFPGCIHHKQIREFLSEISTGKNLKENICSINKSQVQNNEIRTGKFVYEIIPAKIYIDQDKILELPTIDKLKSLCKDLGSLVTAEEFIEGIINKTNPIDDAQYERIKNISDYYYSIVDQIFKHEHKDLIIDNLIYLPYNIQKPLVDEIKEHIKLLSYKPLLKEIGISIPFAIGSWIVFNLFLKEVIYSEAIGIISFILAILSSAGFLGMLLALVRNYNYREPYRHFIYHAHKLNK